MYEQFFGLSENPFSLTPDPRFIYSSRSHDEALAHLRYWVEHREGFAMITGEVGTGKTTALFRLVDGMARQYEIAFLTNSTLTPVELLEEICRKFRIDLSGDLSKPILLQKLETQLNRLRDLEHGAILIIDEAQNFDHSLLEEVRLLSNITRPGGPPLLQIALVGQPELERKLGLPELRQLKQRIGVHYRIDPLSETESAQYIHHRVQVAGGYPRVLFPADTVKTLYEITHGLPREINQVASQSLLGAYVEDSTSVRPEHVRGAVREMNFTSVLERSTPLTVMPLPSVPPVEPVPPPPRPLPRAVADAPPPQTTTRPAVSRAPVTDYRRAEPPQPNPAPGPPPMIPQAPATPKTAAPPQGETRRFDPVAPVGARPVQYGPERKGPPRLVLVIGGFIIVMLAAYLAFAPHGGPKGEDLQEIANDPTVPKEPPSPLTGRPAGDLEPLETEVLDKVPDPAGQAAAATPAGGVTTPSGSTETSRETGPAAGAAENAAASDVVPAPAPVQMERVDPARAYRLQVASLRDSNNAEIVGRQAERASGWSYSVSRSRQGELTWYAVFVGSFASRDAAVAARDSLAAMDRQFSGAIIREPR